jgi:hypothetical protein
VVHVDLVFAGPVESFSGQDLQAGEVDLVPAIKRDVFLRESSPTPPTSFTGEKKLAATAAWLAEPPSRRGFSLVGVLMESSAVVPTMRTLMVNSFEF